MAPYERVANDLLGRIRRGALPAGCQLPSEARLAGKYGVARGTVRRAVRETSGHVEARHGVGRARDGVLSGPHVPAEL
ncbi:GntR family transcriptional regulator [Streptomyces sp. ISL-43]|uniref:GntR family transcriptional regulator n=1 Tax=Streptomyces sp. ISL-43 TaxID=2819183 RepID=UPI001BE7941B|nr:GntR family transcriptional regulator [Streptomyces sp. ISL-43]